MRVYIKTILSHLLIMWLQTTKNTINKVRAYFSIFYWTSKLFIGTCGNVTWSTGAIWFFNNSFSLYDIMLLKYLSQNKFFENLNESEWGTKRCGKINLATSGTDSNLLIFQRLNGGWAMNIIECHQKNHQWIIIE